MIRQVTIATGAEIDNVYDVRNRLTSVTNKDSSGRVTQVVGYTYDMFGDLIGRSLTVNTYTGSSTTPTTSTTTTARFVFDGNQMVLAFDGSGNLTDRILNGPSVDQVLADEHYSSPTASPTTAGSTLWMLGDNAGTIRDIVDNSGTLQDHLTYNSFGVLTGQSGPAAYGATDVIFGGYTGAFYDSATGLQYHNDSSTGITGRWYNPELQRWMSEDPIFPLSGSNPYGYSNNAPTNFTDPSGLAPPGSWLPVPGPISGGGTYKLFLGQWYRYTDASPQPTPIQPPVVPSAPYNAANDPSDPNFDINDFSSRYNAAIWSPHDNRNFWNQDPSFDYAKKHWVQLPGSQAIYHQIGPGNEHNLKFVSPDGHCEAVFHPNGTLVKDQTNGGTYNHAFSPSGDLVENAQHLMYDVVPYWLWGNGPYDKGTLSQRFGGGGPTVAPPPPPTPGR